MTSVLALALMAAMAWYGPHLGLRLFGGRKGVLIGGLGALALAPAVGFGLAIVMSRFNGRPPHTEFEATMNAWGLALFATGAVCLQLIRRVRREQPSRKSPGPWPGPSQSASGDSHGGADGNADGGAGGDSGGDGD